MAEPDPRRRSRPGPARPEPESPGLPAVAVVPVAIAAGLVAVVHLAAASLPRRWFDEDLMLAIGRHHLDWGAVDQPPLTPLLARLADTLAPGSPLVLAVPAVAATSLTVVLVALMARELGGDGRAQGLAAIAQATSPAAAQFGHWLTPYTLEPALWALLFWLLLRWIRVRDDRLLLLLGVVVGIAAQTRLAVAAPCLAVAVSVALVGPRRLLRRPALWTGAVIALLVAAPTVVWQAVHGWPQLAVARAVAQENGLIYGNPGLLALHGLAVAGPMVIGLTACGLFALWRDPRWHDHRFLGPAFVLLWVVVTAGSGRHYYVLPMYGVLVAVGAVALQHRRATGRIRAAWPVVTIGVVVAVGALLSSVVLASPRFADELVSTTARAYQALPAERRERTALGAAPYVYAAHLDAADPRWGLPPAAGTNRAYGWFPPPPDRQDDLLFVGDPDRIAPWFTTIRPVATVDARTPLGSYGGLVPETTTIWLLSGRTAPWTDIWPALRDITLTPSTG